MKKFLLIGVFSAFVSTAIVSYTSWWQIQNLSWLRALIYLEDNESNPCQDQHEGYGRLYKHGCFVNPVSVVQSVGDVLDKIHHGAELTSLEESALIKAVDFLSQWAVIKTYDDGKEYLVAPYQFSWGKYELEAGWISGMAQGHIIEALVAAYEVTNNGIYLNTAEQFANAFYVPVEDGGVTVWTEHGPWFEEYAQAGKEPSFALNGHIFAIEGLNRLAHYSPKYKQLVYQAVATTESMIEQFSTGWWSRYDLRGTMANQKYHHIHIRQLHWLGIEFGSKVLDDTAESYFWAQILPYSSVLRLVASPSRFLGFILVLNFVVVFIVCCSAASFWNRYRVKNR